MLPLPSLAFKHKPAYKAYIHLAASSRTVVCNKLRHPSRAFQTATALTSLLHLHACKTATAFQAGTALPVANMAKTYAGHTLCQAVPAASAVADSRYNMHTIPRPGL
jgi:hypothetical protein